MCNGKEAARAHITTSRRLLNSYFGGKGPVTSSKIRGRIQEMRSHVGHVEVVAVFIPESVLRCRHRMTSINLFFIGCFL